MSARDPLDIARQLRNGLTFCVLCGTSGGHLVAGRAVCSRCDPVPLRQWLDALQMSAMDLAEAAKLSRDTVQVALRGERISEEAAEALAELTRLPIDQLRDPRAKEDS